MQDPSDSNQWRLTLQQWHVGVVKTVAYVSQRVALVRLTDPQQAEYIHRWLINGYGGRSLLLSSSYGVKPGLNLQNVKDLPVPVPPLAEQHRIVAKITELLALCDQLKARITTARDKHAQLDEALVAQAVAAEKRCPAATAPETSCWTCAAKGCGSHRPPSALHEPAPVATTAPASMTPTRRDAWTIAGRRIRPRVAARRRRRPSPLVA